MATLYTTQYSNLFVTKPRVEIDAKDVIGKMRQIYVTFDLTTAVVANDVIKLAQLPVGSKVISAECVIPATGATGIFSLGWSVSADGLTVADPDGFIVVADLDSGAGAVYGKMELNDSVPGLHKKFTNPVDIELLCTESVASSATAKILINYITE